MGVFRWQHEWSPFEHLEREVDRLLESIKLPFPGLRIERQFPPVNLYELEHEFLLVAELPGVDPESLDLTVAGGVLTLKGVRSDAPGVSEERFRRHERVRGPWQRSLTIPDRVEEDRVAAEFNNGILKIHLPKLPSTRPRQIPVIEHSP
ncbi:MAG TPA: Hsp20/alpha crystallin family protein [Planctomycetaceae bacterium]|nr:Hsp20/alpha crystallin family protein [Planctomycetaceae bacterium]